MSTLTPTQTEAIRAKLASMPHIASGIGTEESACSIAAINLALSGRLTDEIPACMSEVIGRWIIVIQDAMTDAMRNSAEWRELLPLAAGTGREREAERVATANGAYAAARAAYIYAAANAAANAASAASAAVWCTFDPCAVLRTLIAA